MKPTLWLRFKAWLGLGICPVCFSKLEDQLNTTGWPRIVCTNPDCDYRIKY